RGEDLPAASDAFRLRYQEMFEFAPDGQLLTDPHGLILEANHAAAALFRWPKEFLVGKPLALLMSDQHWAAFYKRLARLGTTGGPEEFETQIGRRGEPRDVVMRVVPMGGRETRPAALR